MGLKNGRHFYIIYLVKLSILLTIKNQAKGNLPDHINR